MNNPLAISQGNFKFISNKNRSGDEKFLHDLRSELQIYPDNPCAFPSKIYVINLEERQDRWEIFQRNNETLFEEFDIERWNATPVRHTLPNVVDAIFESFTLCLEHAFQANECVIIMEDDAYLAEGGIEKLKAAWKDLPRDWDVLIGNHYFFGDMEILTDHLAKPTGRASTINFTIFRSSVLQKVEENKTIRDQYPSVRDFDHFLTTELTPINNYTVWPMVSREIPSHSDHRGKILDSATKIRENAHKFIFIDQEKYYSSLEGW